MSERTEAWMRIVVGIISGIIIGLWGSLSKFLGFIHWVYVVFAGKRIKAIADFCNLWNTQVYRFVRYMMFSTNKRPFPFSGLGENMDEYDEKMK
jgi:hypothetical protein